MSRPTYAELGDACATAHAMELIGARWTYPVMRELMLGPKRFGELLDAVLGITPAVLSSRLRELSTAGLIESTDENSPHGALAYDLTAWARELAPILRQLGRWAQSSPVRISAGGLTPDAAAQAMITMAEGVRPPRNLCVQLHLVDERVAAGGDHPYVVRWTRTGLTAHRGQTQSASATVHGDSSAWGRTLFADLPLDHSGMTITGDRSTVATLVATFRDGPPT